MSTDVSALREAQASGLTVGVVPVEGNSSSLPLRLELDDFIQDVELANLYFLALERFMTDEEATKPFSYAEISGIHGQPYRPWDGVGSARGSYCHHGTTLFPTWHRAYLSQFEQALFLVAAEIAPALNAEAVLDRFRIPYFDPLIPRQKDTSRRNDSSRDEDAFVYGLPIIMTLPEIRLRRPESPRDWTLGPNPLYSYRFQIEGEGWNMNMWRSSPLATQQTVRGLSRGQPNHTQVMRTLDNVYDPFSTMSTGAPAGLYRLMFQQTDWIAMSNHSRDPRNRMERRSLEGFHDDIHVFLGGHMRTVDFAGFDPAFWLHHCNVDRLLSLWQGLRSLDPESQQWWASSGRNPGPDAPLEPFRKTGSKWWTSNDVRDHRAMGYDYPETAAALKANGDQPGRGYVNRLRAWANRTLGWADPNTNIAVDEKPITDLEDSVNFHIPFFPDQVEVDGRTALSTALEFIGSKGVPASSIAGIGRLGIGIGTRLNKARLNKALLNKAPIANRPDLRTRTIGGSFGIRSLAVAKSVPEPDADKPDVDEETKVEEEKQGEFPDPEWIRAAAVRHAIPGKDPSFEERFSASSDLIDHDKMMQWNVSFSVDKFTLDGSFSIFFFLGDFEPTPEEWAFDPHLAGASHIFASTRERIEGSCDNCLQQEELGDFKYADTVSLTQALLVYYRSGEEVNGLRTPDLTAETVVPFLKRNLHWRIVQADGTEATRESVPSLKVMVYSEVVHLPRDITDSPTFEDQIVHYSVTDGRPTGLNEGESDGA